MENGGKFQRKGADGGGVYVITVTYFYGYYKFCFVFNAQTAALEKSIMGERDALTEEIRHCAHLHHNKHNKG